MKIHKSENFDNEYETFFRQRIIKIRHVDTGSVYLKKV